MSPSRLHGIVVLGAIGVLAALLGCTPATRENKDVTSGGTTVAPASSETPTSPEATAGEATLPGAEAGKKTSEKTPTLPPAPQKSELSPALQELKNRIQPVPDSKKPEEFDEKKLVAESAETMKKFVDSLQKGDVAAGESLMFDDKLFREVVSPGFRDILEGHVLAANQTTQKRLIESLKGKSIEHSWKPGEYAVAPGKSTFVNPVPTMSRGILELTADGITVLVSMDQLVYTSGGWRIFRMSTP